MTDLFDKCDFFLSSPYRMSRTDLEVAAEIFGDVSPPRNAGPWLNRDGARMLQFSSNDYLGLAMHPDVRQRAVEVVSEFGVCSPMGSRAMTGTTADHLALEREVADFKRCEAALVFSTGGSAMMGALACVAGPQDYVFLDQFAHASLVCGTRISGATPVFFRHNDMDHLESLLQRHTGQGGLAIAVDGVYSMQGDLTPLPKLVKLKRDFGARLLLDDAHGTGVFGPQGRGTAFHFGLEREIDLHLGTFSKAVGTLGGFAAGERRVIDFLRFSAPTLLFTKSLPLAVVAATSKALQLLQAADAQRERLWNNARRLQKELVARGFDIGTTESPITPVQFAGAEALRIARELRRSHHIWASPVLFPAVELGKSIIRLTPTALHEDEHVDQVIDSLSMTACADFFSFAG